MTQFLLAKSNKHLPTPAKNKGATLHKGMAMQELF
jgi:hypothetical protein